MVNIRNLRAGSIPPALKREIDSWLVNGPCIAGAHYPVMVIKFTRAVTMYGQIRRASAGTGCVTSLESI